MARRSTLQTTDGLVGDFSIGIVGVRHGGGFIGGTRLYAETSSRDQYEPTRAFYLRRGYTVAARLPEFYGSGDDKLVYSKLILQLALPGRPAALITNRTAPTGSRLAASLLTKTSTPASSHRHHPDVIAIRQPDIPCNLISKFELSRHMPAQQPILLKP